MAKAIKCDICHNFFEFKENEVRKPVSLEISFQCFGRSNPRVLSFDVCGVCAGKTALNHFYLTLNNKNKEDEIKTQKSFKVVDIEGTIKQNNLLKEEIVWKESVTKRERK
jgi:hypothetical protein